MNLNDQALDAARVSLSLSSSSTPLLHGLSKGIILKFMRFSNTYLSELKL